MNTLKKMVGEVLGTNGEGWEDVMWCTHSDEQIGALIPDELIFELPEGKNGICCFYAWTNKYVYFFVMDRDYGCYCDSVPRSGGAEFGFQCSF